MKKIKFGMILELQLGKSDLVELSLFYWYYWKRKDLTLLPEFEIMDLNNER